MSPRSSSLCSGNLDHEVGRAADEVFLLQRTATNDLAADVPLQGKRPADRVLAGPRSRTGETGTGDGFSALLGKAGQKVHFPVSRIRSGDALSVIDSQLVDLRAT